MKVHFVTLGCKANQYDTEAMKASLIHYGHVVAAKGEPSDAAVVNTCAVTATACAQARKAIRRFVRNQGKPFLAVVGCYPQTDPKALMRIEGVDLVLGTSEKHHLGKYLERRTRGIYVSDILSATDYPETPVEGHQQHTRAFLKIQEGCDQECAYCIVPRARGRSRARDLRAIEDEAERLASRGYLEVVLTGTHLEEGTLKRSLEAVEQVQGIKQIRVSSLDPNEVSERLLRKMASSRKLTRHLHLAIQSGDDKILALMRRPYREEDIQRVLGMVTDILGEETGLGTDILVGFPGEDETSFEKTYRLAERAPFTYLHIFPFSPRPGTKAMSMKPVVPQAKVKERLAALRSLGNDKKKAFQRKFIGRTLEVLVEHPREKETQQLIGITENYLRVQFKGGQELRGKLDKVEIIEVAATGLRGRLV